MTPDDRFRELAGYMANAATLVVRAVRDGAPPHVLARRVDELSAVVERWRVLEHDTRAVEVGGHAVTTKSSLPQKRDRKADDAPDVPPRGGPGYPGPGPEGMTWERWLATNNVD